LFAAWFFANWLLMGAMFIFRNAYFAFLETSGRSKALLERDIGAEMKRVPSFGHSLGDYRIWNVIFVHETQRRKMDWSSESFPSPAWAGCETKMESKGWMIVFRHGEFQRARETGGFPVRTWKHQFNFILSVINLFVLRFRYQLFCSQLAGMSGTIGILFDSCRPADCYLASCGFIMSGVGGNGLVDFSTTVEE
jgi:hypothetical protein